MVIAVAISIYVLRLQDALVGLTFAATNLLIVARTSLWPETSLSVPGLYFSTLGIS